MCRVQCSTGVKILVAQQAQGHLFDLQARALKLTPQLLRKPAGSRSVADGPGQALQDVVDGKMRGSTMQAGMMMLISVATVVASS